MGILDQIMVSELGLHYSIIVCMNYGPRLFYTPLLHGFVELGPLQLISFLLALSADWLLWKTILNGFIDPLFFKKCV